MESLEDETEFIGKEKKKKKMKPKLWNTFSFPQLYDKDISYHMKDISYSYMICINITYCI